MYVEITNNNFPKKFSLQDLSFAELEILQMGLIDTKHHSLHDTEVFKEQRSSCNEMFLKIDQELRKAKS